MQVTCGKARLRQVVRVHSTLIHPEGYKDTSPSWQAARLVCRSWAVAISLAASTVAIGADDITFIPPSAPLTVGVAVVIQVVVPEAEPAFQFYGPLENIAAAQLRPLDSVPFINQDSGRSRTIRLELIPLEAGQLTLPPMEFRSGNRFLSTNPIQLAVVAPEPDDKMVLDLAISHREAYVGQPVIVSGLWAPGYDLEQIVAVDLQIPLTRRDDVVVDLPPQSDFRQQGVIALPLSNRRIPAFVNAGVLEFSMVLRVPEPGELVIEPARLLASIIDEPSPRRRTGFQYPAAFDNQFFRDPGDEPARRVFAVSQELRLIVLPLPDGAPPSFTGVVGGFIPEAGVSPAELSPGGVTTLTIKLRGHPHPRALTGALPALDKMPAFRSRFTFPGGPASAAVSGGSAVFRLALRPVSGEIDQVPPVVLSYFDPVEKRYIEVQTDPLPLHVRGGVAAAMPVLPDGSRLVTPLQPAPPALGENTPWQALVAPPGWNERLLGHGGFRRSIWIALPILFFAVVWYREQRFDLRPAARKRRIWKDFESAWHRGLAAQDPARAVDQLRTAWIAFWVQRFGLSAEDAAGPEVVTRWLERNVSCTDDAAVAHPIEGGRRAAGLWANIDRCRYLKPPHSPTAPDNTAVIRTSANELQALVRQLHQSRLPLP